MNIFIDFEATQFGNYMISIGAVTDQGNSFYSLINPGNKARKKITKFIVDLTGITKDMCAAAKNTDQVLTEFFDWCFSFGETDLHFFCYGNCDEQYIDKARERVTSLKSKFILDYMKKELVDYSLNVKRILELEHEIKLVKIASYYQNKIITQKHNALDDAIMLKQVFDGTESSNSNDAVAFKEYLEKLKTNTEEI